MAKKSVKKSTKTTKKTYKNSSKKSSVQKRSKPTKKTKSVKTVKSPKQSKIIPSKKTKIKSRDIKKTTLSLVYSAIIFIISLIIFVILPDGNYIGILSGLVMIFSGALVLLFIIVEIIFYFSSRRS